MTLSLKCPNCDAGLGDGLDLRASSCHACGYHDGSPAPEAEEPKAKKVKKDADVTGDFAEDPK